MAKKPSKNAKENRGPQSKIICSTCKKEKKPVLLMPHAKRKKIGFSCNCGIFSKSGANVGGLKF